MHAICYRTISRAGIGHCVGNSGEISPVNSSIDCPLKCAHVELCCSRVTMGWAKCVKSSRVAETTGGQGVGDKDSQNHGYAASRLYLPGVAICPPTIGRQLCIKNLTHDVAFKCKLSNI